MLNFIKRNLLTLLFLIAELVLYIFIIFVCPNCTNILQWVSILLCFIFAVGMTRKINFINLGLMFTVVADGYLVLSTKTMQAPGMSFFALTSICYFLFLFSKETGILRKIHLFSRIFLIVIVLAITGIVLREKTDYLSMVSMFYFTNLILNLVFSFITFRTNKIFSIGLVLFLLCDTVVGLSSAANVYFPVKEGGFIYSIIHAPINLAWLFYLPSQVLISLFGVINSKRK